MVEKVTPYCSRQFDKEILVVSAEGEELYRAGRRYAGVMGTSEQQHNSYVA